MEVFVMICHKIMISREAKELSIMLELKHLMEGILQWPPAQQRLYRDDQLLYDSLTLSVCAYTCPHLRTVQPGSSRKWGQQGIGGPQHEALL